MRARMVVWLAAAGSALACSGNAPRVDPPANQKIGPERVAEPARPEFSCKATIDHALPFSFIGPFDDNDLDNARSMFMHRCETDRWSADFRNCLSMSSSFEEGRACERYLTKEQLDLLVQDVKGLGHYPALSKPTL